MPFSSCLIEQARRALLEGGALVPLLLGEYELALQGPVGAKRGAMTKSVNRACRGESLKLLKKGVWEQLRAEREKLCRSLRAENHF